MNNSPNPIDIHVGSRVRTRRKLLNISQDGLAQHLGLTFQQIQKYERGYNRISASKLFEISRFLNTTPSYFFDGLSMDMTETPVTAEETEVDLFLMSNEGLELARSTMRLRPLVRRRLIDLANTMGADQ